MLNNAAPKRLKLKKVFDLDLGNYSCGSKAWGLAWLYKNNFRVPNGYCLIFDKGILSEDVTNIRNDLEAYQIQFPVIARSSAMQEDSRVSSLAGKFLSIPNINTYRALQNALLRIARDLFKKCPDAKSAGIVIQQLIRGKYAGALFSSNPVNYEKEAALLSVVEGTGSKLLLGKIAGSEYVLQDKSYELISGQIKLPRRLLTQFEEFAKKVRRKYPYPANLEWVVDNNENIWLVQIRPIAELGPHYNHISKVGEKYEEGPNKEKINLRYFARKYSLNISKAWKLKVSTQSSTKDIEVLTKNIRSKHLLSLVLLNPALLHNSVYRQFCDSHSLSQSILKLICEIRDKFVAMECIVKEVLAAEFTGMIQKNRRGFFIEVAKGHYLPKGIAPLNNYLLDSNYKLLDKNEAAQAESYELTTAGYRKLKETKQYNFTQGQLKKIATTLRPLLEELPYILEFGVMKNKQLILLDFSEVQRGFSANPIKTGIISKGIHGGKLIKVRSNAQPKHILDLHKKDHYETSAAHLSKVVIWAKRPALHLMQYIEEYGRENVGFIFSELSLLAHLSINLREMGIPAIWWPGDITPYLDREVQIDALHLDFLREQRLSLIE